MLRWDELGSLSNPWRTESVSVSFILCPQLDCAWYSTRLSIDSCWLKNISCHFLLSLPFFSGQDLHIDYSPIFVCYRTDIIVDAFIIWFPFPKQRMCINWGFVSMSVCTSSSCWQLNLFIFLDYTLLILLKVILQYTQHYKMMTAFFVLCNTPSRFILFFVGVPLLYNTGLADFILLLS